MISIIQSLNNCPSIRNGILKLPLPEELKKQLPGKLKEIFKGLQHSVDAVSPDILKESFTHSQHCENFSNNIQQDSADFLHGGAESL